MPAEFVICQHLQPLLTAKEGVFTTAIIARSKGKLHIICTDCALRNNAAQSNIIRV